MDCHNAEQLIPQFLEKKLVDEDLRMFLRHVRNCPACFEELETSYLLAIALDRIESGESVDLTTELKALLKATEQAQWLHWVFSNVFRSVEVIAGMALAFSAVRAFIIYVLHGTIF